MIYKFIKIYLIYKKVKEKIFLLVKYIIIYIYSKTKAIHFELISNSSTFQSNLSKHLYQCFDARGIHVYSIRND
jgi:hypothetical protein